MNMTSGTLGTSGTSGTSGTLGTLGTDADAMVEVPPPSHCDPTVREASFAIGGPWGRHAVAGKWWTPLRFLLVMASVSLVFGFMQKSPCASGSWNSNLQYTHACYSDVIPLWDAEGLSAGMVPYRDHANEYPVLTGGFMWLTAMLTNMMDGLFNVSSAALFGMLTSLLLAACGLFAVAATAQAAGRRPYDVAIFALSPLLMFHAFTNWDLFAMAFASGALWAWARKQPVIAGILIGLGASAKLYPVLLLLPILVLAMRTRQWRPALWCLGSAAGGWLIVNIPIAIAYNTGWREFFTFNNSRGTEADTLWYVIHHVVADGLTPTFSDYHPQTWLVALVMLAGLAGVAILGLLCKRKPRLAQLAFLAVMVFLVTSKIWSRQYSLWLLPLIALARPRWRSTMLWQLSELGVWISFLLWLMGTENHGIDVGALTIFVLVRDVALLILGVLVVRDMLIPELDVIRQDGLDDPGGGVYDEAPDYPPLQALREYLHRRRGASVAVR